MVLLLLTPLYRFFKFKFTELICVVEKVSCEFTRVCAACENRVQSVLRYEDPANEVEPFRSVMQRFLNDSQAQLSEQETRWVDVRKQFHRTLNYFCVASSKDGSALLSIDPSTDKNAAVPANETLPKDFFALWIPFVIDFKQIWRREHQKLARSK